MLPQHLKGLVLVVLAGDVGAEAGKLYQLLFHFLGGRLDVALHPSEVFFVVHFCPRVSDNLDIFGKEVVSVLERGEKRSANVPEFARASRGAIDCSNALRLEQDEAGLNSQGRKGQGTVDAEID